MRYISHARTINAMPIRSRRPVRALLVGKALLNARRVTKFRITNIPAEMTKNQKKEKFCGRIKIDAKIPRRIPISRIAILTIFD
jgi:hypothetical protein